MTITDEMVEAASQENCHSGKFETGEGGCAALCMSVLGNSRPNCPYAVQVHGKLARKVLTAALATVPGDRKPDAWIGYWPGAGSIDSITRTTRWERTAEEWRSAGAEITPLYAHALQPQPSAPAFQARVRDWMMACFGPEISADKIERNHRFLEEALELVQACGCTSDEAHQLVGYVYGRPVGDVNQEVGGVMVTLAALCLANGFDMHEAGETELARVWTKIEKIRAKQAGKPKHSPLPQASAPTLDEWIESKFAGYGRAMQGLPGEPYMSMADAKHLVRVAVAAFSQPSAPAGGEVAEFEQAIAIVRAQPFYPDTTTGMRQQWVKDQIEAKLRAALASLKARSGE